MNLGRAWFTAMMLPSTGNTCQVDPAEDAAQMLDATIEKRTDSYGDYPPVARFIEGNSGRTLIGVMCTNRWCVVGPHSIGSIPNSAHQGATSIPTTKQAVVKGWFDDQILGVPDATPKYKIHRQVRASLIPDAALEGLKINDFKMGYRSVAVAYFSAPPPGTSKYATKFHFHQGVNTIEMKAELDASMPGGLKWIARINGDPYAFKVDRMDHSSSGLTGLPGTARFRWNDLDEDVWVGCDIGCCLVNGDIY
jgi:hypothetical protein